MLRIDKDSNAYLLTVKNRPDAFATAEELEAYAWEVEAKTNAAVVEVKERAVIEHRYANFSQCTGNSGLLEQATKSRTYDDTWTKYGR